MPFREWWFRRKEEAPPPEQMAQRAGRLRWQMLEYSKAINAHLGTLQQPDKVLVRIASDLRLWAEQIDKRITSVGDLESRSDMLATANMLDRYEQRLNQHKTVLDELGIRPTTLHEQ